jgi:hypothetical protein
VRASGVHTGIRRADITVVTLLGAIAAGVIDLYVLAEPCHALGIFTGLRLLADPVHVVELFVGYAAARDRREVADAALRRARLEALVHRADVPVVALPAEGTAARLNGVLAHVVRALVEGARVLVRAFIIEVAAARVEVEVGAVSPEAFIVRTDVAIIAFRVHITARFERRNVGAGPIVASVVGAGLSIVAVRVRSATTRPCRLILAVELGTEIDGTVRAVITVLVLQATSCFRAHRKRTLALLTHRDRAGVSVVTVALEVAAEGIIDVAHDAIAVDARVRSTRVVVIAMRAVGTRLQLLILADVGDARVDRARVVVIAAEVRLTAILGDVGTDLDLVLATEGQAGLLRALVAVIAIGR